MTTWISDASRSVSVAVLACATLSAPAQTFQLASTPAPTVIVPAVGGGDSWAPILSPDGRYILFASTANNLVVTSNHTALPALSPARLNVFLRDRVERNTRLVSLNDSGTGAGNSDSFPAGLATNGRYALFESTASNLVPSDTNGLSDVFMRDLVNGTTVLVSANTNGQTGNGTSRSGAMTSDGRYVTFVSAANDLVPADTNGIPDVFVRDIQTGTTVLASVGAASLAKAVGSGSSETPDLTGDGRYAAFISTATNLVRGVPGGGDVYIRDLVGGTTVWASAGARAAAQAALKTTNITCFNLALSADAHFVAYEASSNNASGSTLGLILRYNLDSGLTELVYTNAAVQPGPYLDNHSLETTPDGRFLSFIANANGSPGTTTCVYVWDAATGTNVLASGDATGMIPTNSTCAWPTMDDNGHFVAFLSSASNLVTNALLGDYHLFVRDLLSGATTLVDADTNGVGAGVSVATAPQISSNGRLVGFECADKSLVAEDRNRDSDVFIRDVATGTTELISSREPTLASISGNGPVSASQPALSRDGHLVVFSSDADNLVAKDTNNLRDVFVHDQIAGTTTIVSADTNGLGGDGISTGGVISGDGRYVAFTSLADDLVAGDTNRTQDIFVRDLHSQSTVLVSVNASGTGPGNRGSYSPLITANGRMVLFRSLAGNLAAGSFTGENLFARDLQSGKTYPLTRTGLYSATQTSDGRFVTYVGTNGTGGGKLYVWDTSLASAVYTNGSLGISSGAASPDGVRVAYWAGSGVSSLFASDLTLDTNWIIVSGLLPGPHPALRFDASGRELAYTAMLNGTSQVYLYDFQTGSNRLVSQSFDSSGPGEGASGYPEISADGRFIAYRSAATNIVPNDTNDVPDILLFDTQSGANVLLSVNFNGSFPNDRSLMPAFSGDGHTICFQTWATDLISGDFNQASDLFVYSLFWADIRSASTPGDGIWVSWPASAGQTYHVEFKDALPQAFWQELSGNPTNFGNRAYLQDPSPSSQRFYRVRTY